MEVLGSAMASAHTQEEQPHSARAPVSARSLCSNCSGVQVASSTASIADDRIPATNSPRWIGQALDDHNDRSQTPVHKKDLDEVDKRIQARFDHLFIYLQMTVAQQFSTKLQAIEERMQSIPGASGQPSASGQSDSKRPTPKQVAKPASAASDLQEQSQGCEVPSFKEQLQDAREELAHFRTAMSKPIFSEKAIGCNTFVESTHPVQLIDDPERTQAAEKSFRTYIQTFEEAIQLPDDFFTEPHQAYKPTKAEDLNVDLDNMASSHSHGARKELQRYKERVKEYINLVLEAVDWRKWTLSSIMKTFAVCLVLSNVIFLSFIEDAAMRATISGEEEPDWVYTVELVYVCLFMIELTGNISINRWHFFDESERWWNVFDVVLIMTAVFNIVLETFVVGSSSSSNLSFMRVVRVLRLVRVVRVFRLMKELRTLRLMAAMIGGAMLSLVWACVFVAMFTYVAAIFFMGRLSSTYEILRVSGQPPSKETVEGIAKYWGTFDRTMLSLIAAVTGGYDWMDVAKPLEDVDGVLFVAFFAYILFIVFGLLNVLTGVVVEGTKHAGDVDRDLIIEEAMEQEQSFANEIIRFFSQMIIDDEHPGMDLKGVDTEKLDLKPALLKETLADNRVHFYLASIGVLANDAWHCFELLHTEGPVNVKEYVKTLLYYQGNARSIDVALVLAETRKGWRRMQMVTERENALLREAMHSASHSAFKSDPH